MRTALSVARKDAADARRSLTLLVATGTLVLATGSVLGFVWVARDIEGARRAVAISATAYPLQFAVGLIAVFAGFGAVVGERTTGSIKVLLGLPPTRGDVVVGKFLGRSLVVATSVLVTSSRWDCSAWARSGPGRSLTSPPCWPARRCSGSSGPASRSGSRRRPARGPA